MRQYTGSTLAPAGGTPPSCPASAFRFTLGIGIGNPETSPRSPSHDAQAPVTPLLVAVARIRPEPWAGGTFSSLELKALSWVAMGSSHQHRVSEDHRPQF